MFSFRLPAPARLMLAFSATVLRRGPADEQDRRLAAIVDYDLLESASQKRASGFDVEQGQAHFLVVERSLTDKAPRLTS